MTAWDEHRMRAAREDILTRKACKEQERVAILRVVLRGVVWEKRL